jgi:hypothetical protein
LDKACTKCNTIKDTSLFNYRNKSKGTRQAHCRECTKIYLKDHYTQNSAYYKKKAKIYTKIYMEKARKLLFEIKLGNPCEICGEQDPIVLEFDHLDPKTKNHNVAEMVKLGYSCTSILKEVQKCRILCANCHRRVTAREFSYFSHKKQHPQDF